MLYHINFGPPVLGPGAQVVVPVKTWCLATPLAAAALPAWSRYPQPQASASEQVYFFELQGDDQQQTAVLLKDRRVGPRRERAFQYAAAALLHPVEESDRGSGRLRDRPGTCHQLSQSAIV